MHAALNPSLQMYVAYNQISKFYASYIYTPAYSA